MTKETGGNAFPHENHLSHRGMSLRDYFAAKAMQGILSDENFHYAAWDNSLDWVEHVANYSYEMADAMLKAREQ